MIQPAVLICDDEYGPRISIELMLGDSFNCTLVASAPELMAQLRQRRFSCAVVDWNLRGRNENSSGVRLLEEIFAVDPTLSVLVWTAAEGEVKKHGLIFGLVGVLSKPGDMDVIRTAVADAVDQTTRKRASAGGV